MATSLVVRRHLKRLTLPRTALSNVLRRPKTIQKSYSRKLNGPSAFEDQEYLCTLRGIPQCRRRLPSFLRNLAFGFGYPISENFSQSVGAFFSSQRSWALPFRALFRFKGRKNLSDLPFRSCVSFQNRLALNRRSSGLLPSKKLSSMRPRVLI